MDEVPRLETIYREDGETWEDYARRLEKIIGSQRHELCELQTKRKEVGNRVSRKKIERLYVALGAMTARWELERANTKALAEKVFLLEHALRNVHEKRYAERA